MVSYQKWTSIVFEVAKEKGEVIDSQKASAQTVSVGADIWRDRKDELTAATIAEAKNVARQEITV